MSKLTSLSLLTAVLLASGCTYSIAKPGEPQGNIAVHGSGEISLSRIQIDQHTLGAFATSADVPPGSHKVRANYFIEEGDCDSEDTFCEIDYVTGYCEASVNVREGRDYLVTVDRDFSLVAVRVAAKGYFDFSERDDEVDVGAGSCTEISRRSEFRVN